MNRRLSFIIAGIASALILFNITPHKLREQEKGSRSGAREALDFWTSARAYPDNDIPTDRFMRAYQAAKGKYKELPRALAAGIWEPIGPLNLQGRSLSVAVNPQNSNTIYLGTASGGLWRSHTAGLGSDWQQVSLGYPALGIASIVIDPSDSNIIYAGTGEVYRPGGSVGGLVIRTTRGSYGIGILKTTDGGSTWTKSLDRAYNQQTGVQMLRMNPKNSNTIWAATTEGLLKSTDAGGSWNLSHPNITIFEDVIVHSGDTNLIMATYGNLGFPPITFERSTDGGANWSTLGGVPAQTGKALLAMYESNPDIVYASIADSTTGNGGLWKTTDFGDTWTEVSNSGTNGIFGVQGWYSHYVAVHPTDSSKVIHNAVSLSKSTDGGVSFIPVSGGYSDNHGYAIDPNNPNIVYTACDDGIYRSTNFGTSYTNIGFGLQTGQFYNGFSNSTTDSLLATVQSQDHIPGYMYNGSPTWARSVIDEAGWTAIDPTNDNIIYAINRFGGSIARSTNRGSSFSYLASFGSVGSWNAPIVIAPSAPTTLYFGDTRIFKSTNSAGSWTNVSGTIDGGNTALAMAISRTSPDTVFVGMAPRVTTAKVFRTTNGGTGWTNVSTGLPNRYPLDLAVDPNDSRVVYAAFGGFGTGHLFKSTNTGASWTDISGTLPDAPTTAITIDPLNSSIVYVGNDIGVYISTNGGSSWSAFSEGLPDAVIVADLTVSPSNRKLRIATHGNGAYERHMYDGSSPAAYDYRPLALMKPASGSVSLPAMAISGITASFRNSGSGVQNDSFDVRYRILLSGSEMFSTTKRIARLGLGETRPVIFDGSFSPSMTGEYTTEAIAIVSDADASNDTLRGTLSVIQPSITLTQATKSYCPYTEIVGGSAGPSGDDVQSVAALPFSFIYDGTAYTQLQISTNGWVEFGTGTPGSTYGISTSGQLGGFFRQALSSSDRPTKALGLWWTDLATGSLGSITYQTQGSAPNRIFVVQWKNVLPYYDEGVTTMRINFQVWLNESSQSVEFHYGPIVPGSFPGYATGASMGLKDHLGGDYRYYDIARQSTGLASELRTDLTPSLDWPGEDSCFTFSSQSSAIVDYDEKWNLISVPLQRSDNSVASVYPAAIAGTLYEYGMGGYTLKDSLIPGKGYWAKFPASGSQNILGDPQNSIAVNVDSGWNIIGSVDHAVPVPSGGIVASNVYEYSAGYSIASSILPGRGYWVKTSSGGSLILGPASTPKRDDKLAAAGAITFASGAGKQTLYVSGNPMAASELAYYELPPASPRGGFDVRFASGRLLESAQAGREFQIRISNPSNIINLNWEMKNVQADLLIGGNSLPLSGSGNVVGMKGASEMILRIIRTMAGIPEAYRLEQNHPNPFNPATNFEFAIQHPSSVSLKVFDLLGQEVATVVHEVLEAGVHRRSWDAGGLPTGVYFYRLDAGSFTETKKLMLVR